MGRILSDKEEEALERVLEAFKDFEQRDYETYLPDNERNAGVYDPAVCEGHIYHAIRILAREYTDFRTATPQTYIVELPIGVPLFDEPGPAQTYIDSRGGELWTWHSEGRQNYLTKGRNHVNVMGFVVLPEVFVEFEPVGLLPPTINIANDTLNPEEENHANEITMRQDIAQHLREYDWATSNTPDYEDQEAILDSIIEEILADVPKE